MIHFKTFLLPLSLVVLLISCLGLDPYRSEQSQDEDNENLIYQVIVYGIQQFPTPKYYDLNERIKRLIIVSPAYSESHKKQIQDMVVQALWKIPNIQVIEREQIEAILEEQELGVSGIISTKSAVRLGEVAGADHIFTYSLDNSEASEKTYNSGSLWGKVSARIYNTESGEIVYLCSAVSNSVGVKANYMKKFYYEYVRGAIVIAFWGFEGSLRLAFGQPALGVMYLTPEYNKNFPQPAIHSTWIFSPGDKAGLVTGDLILQADDINIYNQHQLTDLVKGHDINEPMKLKILRQNQEKIVYVHFR